MPEEYVYRIVRRPAGSNDEWTQDNSRMSSTGRPYTKEATAKGEVTCRKRLNSFYEYRVERSCVVWESLPEVDGG